MTDDTKHQELAQLRAEIEAMREQIAIITRMQTALGPINLNPPSIFPVGMPFTQSIEWAKAQ